MFEQPIRGVVVRDSQVTVLQTPPFVLRGIVATLEETEFEVVPVATDDVAAWLEHGGMAIVSARHNDDLDLVVDLRQSAPDGTVITLVGTRPANLARSAIQAGATSSIPLDGEIRSIVLALRAAQSQLCVVPEALGRDLGARPGGATGVELTEAEIGWLASLAGGATVGEVAADAGYSARAMFRLLGSVYGALGAETRVGALVQAARLGLI